MLIRSQDKSRLISFNNTRELRFWECAQGFNITDCVCPIGHYSTKAKAMKVLDMIQEAYVNGHMIIRCQRTVRWLYDYILIRIYTWNHIRSGRSCMRSDHVRQAPPRRLERRTVC